MSESEFAEEVSRFIAAGGNVATLAKRCNVVTSMIHRWAKRATSPAPRDREKILRIIEDLQDDYF